MEDTEAKSNSPMRRPGKLEFRGVASGEIRKKRLPLRGITQVYDCSACKTVYEHDFIEDAWNPHFWAINQVIYFSLYCRNCDKIWRKKVRLNVTLEAVDG